MGNFKDNDLFVYKIHKISSYNLFNEFVRILKYLLINDIFLNRFNDCLILRKMIFLLYKLIKLF